MKKGVNLMNKKYCPFISTKGDWQKCLEDLCMLYNGRDCNINNLDLLNDIEYNTEETYDNLKNN